MRELASCALAPATLASEALAAASLDPSEELQATSESETTNEVT